MLRRFVQGRPFTAFYVLALVIASLVVVWRYHYGFAYQARTGHEFNYLEVIWAGLRQFHNGMIYPNIIAITWIAFREPIYFGVFLFAGAPTISAIVVSLVGGGWSGLKRLFARLRPWPSAAFRGSAIQTYAILTGTFFALSAIHLALIYNLVGEEAAARSIGAWGFPFWLFWLTFLIGGFIDEGATCEELGWRGFALPTLLDRMRSPLTVALLLGFLWWLWHFPREIPDLAARGMPDGFIWGQTQFLAMVMAMSVVMTFFFHRTGGSVIPAILLHGWGNYLSKGVGIYTAVGFDERIWLWLAAAVLLVLFAGPKLGRERYLRLQGGDPEPVTG